MMEGVEFKGLMVATNHMVIHRESGRQKKKKY
jgi:hypothetical protein